MTNANPDAGGGHILADSGEREKFETGAHRDSRIGKGRFDLISPMALRRLALVCERGAAKYGDRNYEKGMPVSRFLDSAMRHLCDYLEGKRDEDHLVQAAWNCLSAVHIEEMVRRGQLPASLSDLPNYLAQPDATEEKPNG